MSCDIEGRRHWGQIFLMYRIPALKVVCPQSRLPSKSSALKVVCPQSRLPSKSWAQRRGLNVACPQCPIVGWEGPISLQIISDRESAFCCLVLLYSVQPWHSFNRTNLLQICVWRATKFNVSFEIRIMLIAKLTQSKSSPGGRWAVIITTAGISLTLI